MQLPGNLTYTACKAPKAHGAVLLLPGGGYRFLSEREGEPVADAFASMGYCVFTLNYSVCKPKLGLVPLREAAAALRFMYDEAGEYGFPKNNLILCGFSAGAHLAGSLGVFWNRPELTGIDIANAVKPAAMVLGYPVVTMGKYSHEGSRAFLTGGDEKLAEIFSLEKHVSPDTPPAFIWNTFTDEKVPAENGILLAQSMFAANVPCEFHMFHSGKHGMSLANEKVESPEEGLYPDTHIAHWVQLCEEWLSEVLASQGRN